MRGITQAQLAKRAGVSQKLISAIETGVNPMVEPSRTRIWNALHSFELEAQGITWVPVRKIPERSIW